MKQYDTFIIGHLCIDEILNSAGEGEFSHRRRCGLFLLCRPGRRQPRRHFDQIRAPRENDPIYPACPTQRTFIG